MMAAFDSSEFWSKRHKENDSTEWYCQSRVLAQLLGDLELPPGKTSILFLGTGLSRFPEEVYDSGFSDIVVVDMSEAAIAKLKERNQDAGRSGLQFLAADLGDSLPLEHAPFHLIIDKGALDCVLSGKRGNVRGEAAVRRLYQLLRPTGVLLLLSHSPPEDRRDLLCLEPWLQMQVRTLRTPSLDDAILGFTEEVVTAPRAMLAHRALADEDSVFDVNLTYAYILCK